MSPHNEPGSKVGLPPHRDGGDVYLPPTSPPLVLRWHQILGRHKGSCSLGSDACLFKK